MPRPNTPERRGMPEARTERFEIRGFAEASSEGFADVLSFNKGERMRRALKGLGISWLAGFGGLFIPVAHFLLVPGFFLFGIYVFVTRLKTEEITTKVAGICPDCAVEQEFEAGGTWGLPRSMACVGCGRTLRATVMAAAD